MTIILSIGLFQTQKKLESMTKKVTFIGCHSMRIIELEVEVAVMVLEFVDDVQLSRVKLSNDCDQ